MNTAKLFQQSTLYLLGNTANRAVSFVLVPLYTHYLQPSDYAIIELIDLFLIVCCISVGLQSITTALIRLHHDEHDDSGRRRLVSTAWLILLMLSAAVCVPGVLQAESISRLVLRTPAYASLVRISFIGIFLGNLVEFALTYLRLLDRVVFFVLYSFSTASLLSP